MVSSLKTGKSYAGFIKVEHIFHGSPKLMFHLHILFNAMLQHGYIPSLMLHGNITPLIKDRDGNVSDSSNYRAITLSSVFIQMFERLQKAKFGCFFPDSDLQFGFKPGVSTSHAVYSLNKTVNYFNQNGSCTFLAFLDCSKAFDRISHCGLFTKLIQHNFLLCFLLCVMYLYMNMTCSVKWDSHMGPSFDIPTGTKQGGILSPDFFKLYSHGLIKLLQKCGYGCKIIQIVIACLFFADDIVLLSPSRFGLQRLLDICVSYCKKFCLDFNVKKSKVMVIGCSSNNTAISPLLLNNEPMEFVNQYKYLGVEICAGKSLEFSVENVIRSFHRAANAILYSPVKPSNEVLLKLLYTNCVPIVSYCCAVRVFKAADMNRCNVAINNAIRKIFSFATWESIRHLRMTHGYSSIYEIFETSRTKFLHKAPSSSNFIVRHLYSLNIDGNVD